MAVDELCPLGGFAFQQSAGDLGTSARAAGAAPAAEASLSSQTDADQSRPTDHGHPRRVLAIVIGAIVLIAVIVMLLFTFLFSMLQVTGSSMEPTLSEDDVVILTKSDDLQAGELVGFYNQNKLLIKRVIGLPGDEILIDGAGNVSVNGDLIEESYITGGALGSCDIDFPYQVPEDRYFVLGDNRADSLDSRLSAIGCVEQDQVVGTVSLRIWPLNEISFIH